MSTDPMLDDPEKFSINTFTGDGSTTSWEINFAGGYIRKAHVKAYYTDPDTDENTILTISDEDWIGANTLDITPAVPDGFALTIYRDTPKDEPVADFLDGAIVNEINLDYVAKQSVFVSAELLDRFVITAALAEEALANSELAITASEATIGGDFTAFARTNVASPWTVAQNFFAGTQIDGSVIANQDYVTTSISTALSTYATDVELAAGIATAAADATTKADAALVAAAVLVTAEANRAKSIEGFLRINMPR